MAFIDSKPTFFERAFLKNDLYDIEANLRGANSDRDAANTAYDLAATPEHRSNMFGEYLKYKDKGVKILTDRETLLRHIAFRKAVLIAFPVIEVATGLVAIGLKFLN